MLVSEGTVTEMCVFGVDITQQLFNSCKQIPSFGPPSTRSNFRGQIRMEVGRSYGFSGETVRDFPGIVS